MKIWKRTKERTEQTRKNLKVFSKYLLKICFVLVLVAYIFSGTGSMALIVEREYIKFQDISEFPRIADKFIKLRRLKDLDVWLKYRPLEDNDEIIKVITNRASEVDAPIIFRVADKLSKAGNSDEAAFWFQLGKYRLRYDMLRCGATKAIDSLDGFVEQVYGQTFQGYKHRDPSYIKYQVAKVVEFDKEHPPQNDFDVVCSLAQSLEDDDIEIVGQEYWGEIRKELINSAQEFISSYDYK